MLRGCKWDCAIRGSRAALVSMSRALWEWPARPAAHGGAACQADELTPCQGAHRPQVAQGVCAHPFTKSQEALLSTWGTDWSGEAALQASPLGYCP